MSGPKELLQRLGGIARSRKVRKARRYAPFVVGVVTLVLIVTLVPTVSPPIESGFGPTREATGVGQAGTGTVEATPSTGRSSTGATSAREAPGGPTGDAAVADESVSTGGEQVGPVHADCERRQFAWSKNAPCSVAFSGSNGGATSRGVTPTEIVASFRISDSGQSAAVEATAQGRNLNQRAYLHDLQMYVNFFNAQYQLYGRKVVVKEFRGRGDWLAEYQGQNLEGAQADAATAKDLGAFVDLSTAYTSTSPPYAEALADQGIVSAGGAVASQLWFEQRAPFAISFVPALDALANFWGAMACQRMVSLKAIFSGDAGMRQQPRAFGLIAPEVPDYTRVADDLQRKITACGGKIARRVNYSLNIATLSQQAASAIAQMKAAGATTLICMCDTLSPTLLSHNAQSQDYYPEWLATNVGDDYGQQRNQDVWKHALLTAGDIPDPKTTESYRVYKMADPEGEPQLSDVWLPSAYYAALLLFNGMQTAGPVLTPSTLTRGVFSLPPSLPGAEFPWEPGDNIFTPASSAKFGWWDPNTPSPSNGRNGTSRDCAGDTDWRPIQRYRPEAYGPKGTQLRCFGG